MRIGIDFVPAPAALADPPGDDAGDARVEEAFRRWDEVRARSSLQPDQGSVSRAAGFLGRTATRVRDLGVSWERQRDLFQALIDRQNDLGQRLRALEPLLSVVAGLKSTEADILGALDAMWKLHEKHEAGGSGGTGEPANLCDRLEVLRVRQARLECALADLWEEVAALHGGAGGPVELPSNGRLPLAPRDFAELLAMLERDAPAGEGAQAVEVSLQDVRAENLLLVAWRHFGGRLASSGPRYRGPNDLWIHVDFTSDWSRPALLENAAARLASGGRFLLVTATTAGEPPQHEHLVQEEDREVPLAAGGPVRVLAWRRRRA